MENDAKDSCILKYLRHKDFTLSGFNSIEVEKQESVGSRQHYICNSFDDIRSMDCKEACPLTVLSWDIEVCTGSGKFDNDGCNPANKVNCIGFSFNYLMQKKVSLMGCITYVDSNDN